MLLTAVLEEEEVRTAAAGEDGVDDDDDSLRFSLRDMAGNGPMPEPSAYWTVHVTVRDMK
jgi:hypothetical protein